MNPTVADRNLNPGNLKNPSTGSFHQFPSEGEGYAALMNDLQSKVNGTSSTGLNGNSTLYDFSSKYAPSSDKNDPAQYTANLANRLGVRPDTKLSELKDRIPDFAQAVASNEGYTPAKGFKASPQQTSDTNSQPSQNNGYVNTANIVDQTPTPPPARKKDWLEKAGDVSTGILNFTGGNKIANLLGTELAVGKEKIKGAFGGQDNSQYIPHSADDIDPVGTALDAGRVALSIGAIKSLGGLLGKSMASKAAVTVAENAPSQIVQDLTGVPASDFNAATAIQKNNMLTEALSSAQKGADQTILRNAIDSIKPSVLMESGAGSFGQYHPVLSAMGGLVAKAGKFAGLTALGAGGVGGGLWLKDKLLPPPRQ